MPLIVDSHEDIADNIISLGRDYSRPVAETRRIEANSSQEHKPEETLLSWEEYQRGQVAVIFSTLFGAPVRSRTSGHTDSGVFYKTPEQAHQVYHRQLDLYHRMTDEHPDMYRLIKTKGDLEAVLQAWEQPVPVPEDPDDHRLVGHPVGLVVLMEGAEGILNLPELEEWWQGGVRLIGLAWMGNRYTGGTREPGPLTPAGRELLGAMADLGFTLDLSHMDPQSARQALDIYPGTIVASHANPLKVLKGSDSNRHLPDAVVDGVIEHNGVIGIVPYNKFLRHGWDAAAGKMAITLQDVVAHIDYICQRAGDALHVGIGSDFDGGFGRESVPAEIDTIADLQKLDPLLSEKGYDQAAIQAIFGGNWLRILRKTLPS